MHSFPMDFHSLDICFSGQTDAIADLRASVEVFDEVCRDYEALQAELGALLERGESRDTIWIANVEETLAALTEEIASALEAYADPPGLPDR